MKSIKARTIHVCAAIAITVAPVAASAKSANDLRDLVGARAAGAESDLQSRGWVQTGGKKSAGASYTFWWNGGRQDCVMVETANGRYASIVDVSPIDCNQSANSGNQDGYRGGGTDYGAPAGDYGQSAEGPPPKVRINKNGTAMATLPGCLANYDRDGRKKSSFSSCSDEDLRRMSIAVAATMREQGMGDQSESNAGHSNQTNGYGRNASDGPPPKVAINKNGTASATLPGCLATFDRNGRKTSSFSSCRDEDLRRMSIAVDATMREQGMGGEGERNSGESYGGSETVNFSDLVGAKAAGVDSELQSRGFRSVDGFQSGSNGKGTIWWNDRTRQCLQMITVNGRADSITDIQTHPRCR